MRLEAQKAAAEPARRDQADDRRGPVFVPFVVPWSIDVSLDLAALMDDEIRGDEVIRPGVFSLCQKIREQIFAELGVPLPAARVRLAESLPERHFVISLFEVPARIVALPGEMAPTDALFQIDAAARALLRARAGDFMGIAETQQLLDQLEQIAPALVRQLVPKPLTLSLLADVLRRMVEERVSIRDLRAILEGLSLVAATEKDPLNLAEFARGQLRRATTYRLTGGRPELSVYLLDAPIEEAVRHAITRTASGSFLTLAPAAGRDVVAAVRRAVSEFPPPEPLLAPGSSPDAVSPGAGPTPGRAVILTQPDIRRFVRKLIEVDMPEMTVVSFAELLPEISLRPLAKATL
jgi:type III secretion protein V